MSEQEMKPVARQWCVTEQGHQKTSWEAEGYGDEAGWHEVAKRYPDLVGERCPAAAYTENLGNAQYPPCRSRKFVHIFVERDGNMQARLTQNWRTVVRGLFMER